MDKFYTKNIFLKLTVYIFSDGIRYNDGMLKGFFDIKKN